MAEGNDNYRLEAFCDGVFAIAITLLVIDIRLPSSAPINSTSDFWLALGHIGPSIFAFVLSFVVILITWVNHHACLKLVHTSCASFIYANGFLLLTVVIIPFPTSLMGEHLLTDHAAPAVVLYDAVLAVQGLAWVLLCGSAVKNLLTRNETSTAQMRVNRKSGLAAFVVYCLLAILAFWLPMTAAVITSLTWFFWLVYGINIRHA